MNDSKSIITIQLTSCISADVCRIVIQYYESCLFGCKTKCGGTENHLYDISDDISCKGIGIKTREYFFRIQPPSTCNREICLKFPRLPIEDRYASQLFCLNCGNIDLNIERNQKKRYLLVICKCGWKMFSISFKSKPLLDTLNYILYHHRKMMIKD